MKNNDCAACGNSGVRVVMDGPDDVREEYCLCPLGVSMESGRRILPIDFIESEGSPMLITIL